MPIPTLPDALGWPLALLLAGAGFVVAMGLYRFAFGPLLLWALRANPARAMVAVQRLAGPYTFMAAALSANALRLAADGQLIWWLGAIAIPAVLVFAIEAVRLAVVDVVIAAKRGSPVPKILKDLAFGLLYLTVGLACLGTVFKVDIAPFLTTSAILSVVIGLALQDTLGNLFAGVAINLDRPFSIGDWIEVDGHKGQVHEISWRATKILTRQHQMIVIPNSHIAKVQVTNLSTPTPTYGEVLDMRASFAVPPNQIREAVFEVVAGIPEILTSPVPEVHVLEYTESAIMYRLIVWIDDAARATPIRGMLLEGLWFHFKRKGIDMPFPIREVHLHEAKQEGEAAFEATRATLHAVDFMSELEAPALDELARKARHVIYAPKETVFRRGDPGGSLFVITRGQVTLHLDESRLTQPLAHLSEGDYFGEMSLLTGETRTATARAVSDCELLVIEQQHLAPLLEANPEIVESISRLIAKRRAGIDLALRKMAERQSRVPQQAPETQTVEAASNEILGRIRAFFKLS